MDPTVSRIGHHQSSRDSMQAWKEVLNVTEAVLTELIGPLIMHVHHSSLQEKKLSNNSRENNSH